jgi:TPR repeat protein
MTNQELIQRAVEGDTEAQVNLGYKYYLGLLGFEKDIDQARFWWQKAAKYDNKEAQFNIGMLFYTGEGMPNRDEKAAKDWWQKAAANGSQLAVTFLRNPPELVHSFVEKAPSFH